MGNCECSPRAMSPYESTSQTVPPCREQEVRGSKPAGELRTEKKTVKDLES
ncbi:unnamed protein product, partial [Nesidiocoris tenuis]